MSHSLASLESSHAPTLIQKCATTIRSDGRYNKAEKLEVELLDVEKRVLEDEYPSSPISMGILTLTYSKLGRLKEAEALELQVVEKKSTVLGDDHPATLTSTSDLVLTDKIKDGGKRPKISRYKCCSWERKLWVRNIQTH